jgi:hypothetical protein
MTIKWNNFVNNCQIKLYFFPRFPRKWLFEMKIRKYSKRSKWRFEISAQAAYICVLPIRQAVKSWLQQSVQLKSNLTDGMSIHFFPLIFFKNRHLNGTVAAAAFPVDASERGCPVAKDQNGNGQVLLNKSDLYSTSTFLAYPISGWPDCTAVGIALATRTEDPGSNPTREQEFWGANSNAVVLNCLT